jgi:3-phosphoshikimate 1-carboxyvinyltransferase
MIRIANFPKNQSCHISLPYSKSIINRLLVINHLAGGAKVDVLDKEAEDIEVMQALLKKISDRNSDLESNCEINVGDAGTVMRFLLSVLAITPGNWFITGSDRMQNRPVKPLTDALLQLGAELSCFTKPGYPPVQIKGKSHLHGRKASLDASISSQFISALMLIGPMLSDGIEIELLGEITSGSYIKITESLMKKAGAEVHFTGNHIFINPGGYKKVQFYSLAEPDWSAAAFWFEIVALAPQMQILLKGLTETSVQGDAVLPLIFSKLGVNSVFTDEGLLILNSEGPHHHEFNYDFTDCPDLAQSVIVTCAALGIKGHFKGLKTLRIKETDRIDAIYKELTKLGYDVEVIDDQIVLQSNMLAEAVLQKPVLIHCYDDHRMAMSFAPLALIHGNIYLDDPDVVKKSYPGYWKDIAEAGVLIDED